MIDITDKFLCFETENNLFDIEIQNCKFWSLIREDTYFDIIRQNQKLGKAHSDFSSQSRLKKILGILSFFKNTITNNKLIYREKDLLVINHSRRVYDGKYHNCLYTDLILKNLDITYYVFEIAKFGEHRKPMDTKDLIYSDAIDLKFYTKYFLNRITKTNCLTYNEIKYLEGLVNKLNSRFDVEISTSRFITKIEKSIQMHLILIKQYTNMLKKIKPKLVIEVVGYERRRKAINSAAKRLNIPTIELQHGTMGKYHIAYNFAEKMDIHTFPDYVFTFGQFWKDNTRLPIDDNRVKVVGWPYFEQKVNEYNKEEQYDTKRTILFISQGTIGKELSKVAIDISQMIDKQNYRIIYKLHPGEYDRWKSEYPWLSDENIEVIDNNHNDMHHYFAKSDIQIGVYSTAIFEGLGYGLKTYIVKLYGHQYMEELYKNNIALLVDNPLSIIKDLVYINESKKSFDDKYFWQVDSLKRLLCEINDIVKQKDKLYET